MGSTESAFEPRGGNCKGFKDFYLKARGQNLALTGPFSLNNGFPSDVGDKVSYDRSRVRLKIKQSRPVSGIKLLRHGPARPPRTVCPPETCSPEP